MPRASSLQGGGPVESLFAPLFMSGHLCRPDCFLFPTTWRRLFGAFLFCSFLCKYIAMWNAYSLFLRFLQGSSYIFNGFLIVVS